MAKNVVITGATSGIGEAIARAYLEKGENIVLTGRRTERLKALKTEFAGAFPNQKVWTFSLDVTDMSMVKTVCSEMPSMVAANRGHIINMGSTAGIYAYAGAAVYSATKAAVKTFSDGLRIDTIATDIKVTTIQPGIVETDFSKVRFHGDEARAATVYQGLEALQAQDIADTVVYVTSQPRRVQITDMAIMANQQATGFMIHRD